MVLGPTSAYLVDIMHSRSAETIAANKFVPVNLTTFGNEIYDYNAVDFVRR